MRMSQIQILQWLLANRDVLTQVIEVAKQFSRHKPYMEQWDVIDKIARLMIPALFKNDVKPASFHVTSEEYSEDYEQTLLALGAEVGALGLDWKAIIDIVLPVILAVLDMYEKLKAA